MSGQSRIHAILVRAAPAAFARSRIAAVHPAFERCHSLGRRSVREALRHHPPGRHLLESVVADCGSSAQTLLGVARLELDVTRLEMTGLRRCVSPHSRKAVGLQFQRDRRAPLAGAPVTRRGGVQAEEVLDVVTELVRDHVRLREVARGFEPACQLVEEPEIEVDAVVAGTIERTGRRLREAARGVDRVTKQHDTRLLVPIAEQRRPRRLDITRDGVNEVDAPFLLRIRWSA